MSRFRTPPSLQFGPVVRLNFIHASGQPCLYCHKAVLAHYSGVLRGLLETLPTNSTGTSAGQSPESSDIITIPLDDADCTAFEEALSFMCPTPPLPSVTWDDVERLLLLSDKYDIPVLREHASIFLQSNLAAACNGTTAFHWLKICSHVNLPSSAKDCIDYIVAHQLPVSVKFLAELQPQQAEALCAAKHEADVQRASKLSALRGSYAALQEHFIEAGAKVDELTVELKTAAHPKKDLICGKCSYVLFTKPNGKHAGYCLNCGCLIAGTR